MRNSGLVLFGCASLLLSGGTILGGSTAWTMVRISYYFWTTDLGVELASSVLMVVGALLCLPTCWLATIAPYNPKCTSIWATMMTLALASMLMLTLGVTSLAGLARAVRDPAAVNVSMHRAMAHVGFDPNVRSSFSAMQIELRCCGVQPSSDWLQYRRTLPPACCGRAWNGKRNDQCVSPIFTAGCLRPALCELRNFANGITVIASSLIIVMAVALFAGAHLLVSETLGSSEQTKTQPPQQSLPLAPQPLRSTPSILSTLPQSIVTHV